MTIIKYCGMRLASGALLFTLLGVMAPVQAAMPAADIDQIRNGSAVAPDDPANWVNGNAGQQNAHYLEGHSIGYRVKMTALPTDGTVITLILEYDIRHSSRNALDYLTNFQRLAPHDQFKVGHPAVDIPPPGELIDPRIDVPAVSGSPISGDDQAVIPVPTDNTDPGNGTSQPEDSYNDLVAAEGTSAVEMAIYNGTFIDATCDGDGASCTVNADCVGHGGNQECVTIRYVSQGDLVVAKSATSISVSFRAGDPTVVLAWGGHIASRDDWGFDSDGVPNSAGGISGSPYHMRLIDWNLNNLGNQDRSLKAAAVFVPPDCAADCDEHRCAGESAECCAVATGDNGPFTVVWEDSSSTTVETCDVQNSGGECCFSTAIAGSYTAIVTDDVGLTSDGGCTFELATDPDPMADAGDDVDQCLDDPDPIIGGNPTASGGTPGYTYDWTGTCRAFLSDPAVANPTFDVSAAGDGSYGCCVEVTDANGCKDSDCMDITVNPEPTADAGDDVDQCLDDPDPTIGGNPTASGGTPGYTYDWTGTCRAFLSDPAVANPTFDVSAAGDGSYGCCVEVTDANGCKDSDCMDITVNPEPTADAGDDVEQCLDDADPIIGGDPTASGGTPSYTYDWNGTCRPFLSDPAVANPSFDVSAAGDGSYGCCVEVTDANGCKDSDCMDITVNPEPTADAGDDVEQCLDDPDPTIGCDPTASGGTAPYAFDWTGTCRPFLSDPAVANPTFDVSAAGDGSFGCCVEVTDANGCKDSDCMDITVNPEPTADAGPDVARCIDDTDPTIGGNPTASGGTPSYTYDWTGTCRDFLNDPAVSNPTFDLDGAGVGTFGCCVEITDSNGCKDSDCMDVTVYELPACSADPFGFASETPQNLAGGADGTLLASGLVSGSGAPATSCTASLVAGTGTGWNLTGCSVSGSDVRVTYNIPNPNDGVTTPSAQIKITLFTVNNCTDMCIGDAGFAVQCTIDPPANVCSGEDGSIRANVTLGECGDRAGQLIDWYGPFPTGFDCSTLTSGALLDSCDCLCPPAKVGDCPASCTACATFCDLSVPNATTTARYCAVNTELNGFEGTCSEVLQVFPNPTCSVNQQTEPICEGETQEFCATPSGGTPDYTVVWKNSANTVIRTCTQADVDAAGGDCCITVSVPDTYTAFVTDSAPVTRIGAADHCRGDCTRTLVVEDCACRVTGGGVDGTVPPKSFASGEDNRDNHYTFGGQAGAPTASQPQPWGEWTHRQHRGEAGKFTFRAGTASAPEGTEIHLILCHDPDNCNPARPAPNKQIDFEGVGSFKNISGNSPVAACGDSRDRTLHWFEVHIEDLGEPGNQDAGNIGSATCPFAGHAGLPNGDAKCACPDFYHIRIYCTENPPGVNEDPIYEVSGYINGGNLQIHPPIGG